MIQNVRGILDAVFEDYLEWIGGELKKLGYQPGWKLMNASDFGVPQLRPRVVFVALRKEYAEDFSWPESSDAPVETVGETLYDLMAANGWKGESLAREGRRDCTNRSRWLSQARRPRPGSDESQTGLGDAGSLWPRIPREAPGPDFLGMPRLTVRMVARLQGFPDDWQFAGSKTQTYRTRERSSTSVRACHGRKLKDLLGFFPATGYSCWLMLFPRRW